MSDHLRDITKMLKPCPFCGKHDVGIVKGTGKTFRETIADLYFAVCYDCGARIDYYDSEEEAAAAWNCRAEDENKPLTWDELKEMEGKPVFVLELVGSLNLSKWHLIRFINDETKVTKAYWQDSFGNQFVKDDDCWIAFRKELNEKDKYDKLFEMLPKQHEKIL